MKTQVRTSNQIEWVPLSNAEVARFAPQLAAGISWLVDLLDKTEHRRKAPRLRRVS